MAARLKTVVGIRLPSGVVRALRLLAKRDDRQLSPYLRRRLMKLVEKREAREADADAVSE